MLSSVDRLFIQSIHSAMKDDPEIINSTFAGKPVFLTMLELLPDERDEEVGEIIDDILEHDVKMSSDAIKFIDLAVGEVMMNYYESLSYKIINKIIEELDANMNMDVMREVISRTMFFTPKSIYDTMKKNGLHRELAGEEDFIEAVCANGLGDILIELYHETKGSEKQFMDVLSGLLAYNMDSHCMNLLGSISREETKSLIDYVDVYGHTTTSYALECKDTRLFGMIMDAQPSILDLGLPASRHLFLKDSGVGTALTGERCVAENRIRFISECIKKNRKAFLDTVDDITDTNKKDSIMHYVHAVESYNTLSCSPDEDYMVNDPETSGASTSCVTFGSI